VTVSLSRLRTLAGRTETRLVLFGACGIGAVYVGFLALPVAIAETLVKRGGYYVMFAACALFLHALWRYWSRRTPVWSPLTAQQRWLTGGAVALFSLLAIGAEPFRSKILNDEFVLQSTAFNMHFFRDVATMVRGYDIQGLFLSTDNYLDKRPYFYPFVVSLVHDLTGYRVLNAYLVNAALMPVALVLVFVFGRQLAGWKGGLVALFLLGSLPLLGQNATGSGMELLNVLMILAGLVLAAEFLRAPGEASLAAFLLAVVLLAQTRYESALYALPAALVGAFGWWRAQRVILPWQAFLVPWLLVPCALQNKVLSNSPLLWELGEEATARFSLDYFPRNARGAVAFFFNTSAQLANSLLLSVAGLLALGGVLWLFLRSRPSPRTANPAGLALFCFSFAVFANTLLVFCYYWSSFQDPMASRFSLPLHLVMAFAVVIVVGRLETRLPAANVLLGLAAVFTAGIATARYAHHNYSHMGIDEIEWTRRYVRSLPPADRVVLSNRTSLPWLLEKRPAILLDRARGVADRLQFQLRDHTFREILVTQSLPPTTPDGDHRVLPSDRLPGFHLEVLAEKRFGTKLTRISRLVAIDDAVLPAAKPAASNLVPAPAAPAPR
jgi:hypothetical protein